MLGLFLWYVSLGLSAILTDEAAPLIGGLMAHDGRLRYWLVVFSVAASTWGFGAALYFLGRWRGDWLRRRFPRTRRVMLRGYKIVRGHPWRSALMVRYAFGLRSAVPIACGAARVPIALYLIASAISSVSWAMLFTALGWGFGQSAQLALGRMQRYETPLIVVILVVTVILYVWSRRSRRFQWGLFAKR